MRKLRNTGEPIDIDAHLPALVSLLEKTPGLVAAFLYGSYGTPDQTPLSDVDFAVLFAAGREPAASDEVQLVSALMQALEEEDVSVTVLNRAPAIFQFRVLETGRQLLCKDAVALADFTAEVLSHHADYMIDYRAFLEEYDEALVREYGRAESAPDPDKLRDKIQFIRDTLTQLEEIRGEGREAFLADRLPQYAAVRCIQIAVEAVLDSANHIIAREGLGLPRTYAGSVGLLVQAGILPAEKQDDFERMIRFRNRAVHLYGEIDPGEVFTIMERNLGDFELFIRAITRRYFLDRTAKPPEDAT